MRGVHIVVSGIMLAACGSAAGTSSGAEPTGESVGDAGADSARTPAPDSASPPAPSRLVSFGPELNVSFDSDGYPTAMDAAHVHYDLTWDAGHLVQATATTPNGGARTGTFSYAADRIVGMAVDNDASQTTTLEYTATGALSRWTTGTTQRTYAYDAKGWLVEIAFTPSRPGGTGSDTFAYGADGCPTSATENGASFSYASVNGRLSTYSSIGESGSYAVVYDARERIIEFSGTGQAFRPIVYEDREGRGLELFPGHFNGGFGYGFPAHSAVFRVDGRCDPTLRSQETITSLLLGSLPSYGGGS